MALYTTYSHGCIQECFVNSSRGRPPCLHSLIFLIATPIPFSLQPQVLTSHSSLHTKVGSTRLQSRHNNPQVSHIPLLRTYTCMPCMQLVEHLDIPWCPTDVLHIFARIHRNQGDSVSRSVASQGLFPASLIITPTFTCNPIHFFSLVHLG